MKAKYSSENSEIIEAERWHMLSITDSLRQADQDEIRAASGLGPDMGLIDSWCKSFKTWAIIHGGEVAAVIGLVRCVSVGVYDTGIPWMLGTDLMDEVKIFFTRQSKRFIRNEMLSEVGHLINYVDVRNKKAVGWLDYCGFELRGPIPFGPDKLPFMKMYLNKEMMKEVSCAGQH